MVIKKLCGWVLWLLWWEVGLVGCILLQVFPPFTFNFTLKVRMKVESGESWVHCSHDLELSLQFGPFQLGNRQQSERVLVLSLLYFISSYHWGTNTS